MKTTPTKRQRAREGYRTRASKPQVKSYYLIFRVTKGLRNAFNEMAGSRRQTAADILRNHAAKYAGWTP